MPSASDSQAGSSSTGIFWAQSPHGGEEEPGTIGRARLDGSGANGRFLVAGKAPAGVALDDRYVYWTDYGAGTIGRAQLDGSHIETHFITGADEPIGIAVDGRHVYWTNAGLDPGSGTIGRADLDGSRADQDFVKAGDSPIGLAVDRRHIYWTHRSRNGDGVARRYAIGRANLDGSGVELHFIDATNKIDGVAVNDSYVYWSNSAEDAIGRARLDGTAVEQRCLAPRNVPLGNVPEGLAVDDQYVYWTNYPANTIGRANLDGSDRKERFIAVNGVPEGIAVASESSAPARSSAHACAGPLEVPVLFGPTDYGAGPYAKGWGEVAPPTISNGGAAASGTIFEIRWRSWGGNVAAGRGLHPTYKPGGGYFRKPVVIEVRASAIRRCRPGGRLVYTRFTAREQVRPGGPMGKWFAWDPNMCDGFR